MSIIHLNPVYPQSCGIIGTELTTTNHKDVSCPFCRQNIDEASAFETLAEQEKQRAVAKYPPELWATFDRYDMFIALKREVNELQSALWTDDIEDQHGALNESVQVAGVARRIFDELLRRKHECTK